MATPIGTSTVTAIARQYILPQITDQIYGSNVILYRLLQDRSNKLVLEMEEDAMGIVNLLEDGRRAAKSKPAEAGT